MTKQKLIEDNMKLVYALMHKEYPTFIEDEDLVQCGMLGLCKAADKYDESRGAFSTLAYYCIRTEIQQELRRRAKHNGVLSLDYEVTIGNSPCDTATLGDLIVGEEDVNFIDVDDGVKVNELTPTQQLIFEMKKRGKTTKEIVEALGTTRQYVWYTMRKIKRMRG